MDTKRAICELICAIIVKEIWIFVFFSEINEKESIIFHRSSNRDSAIMEKEKQYILDMKYKNKERRRRTTGLAFGFSVELIIV